MSWVHLCLKACKNLCEYITDGTHWLAQLCSWGAGTERRRGRKSTPGFDWLPYGGKQKAILEVFLILPIFKIICKTKQSQMISFCTLLVLKSLGGTVWVFSLCSGVPTFQAACLCRTGDRSWCEMSLPLRRGESTSSKAYPKPPVPFSSVPVIPKVTKHLLSNPVFTCIILAACMEIAVVAGFAAFLGKYLEQQFNLTTSSANQLLGE